LGVCGFDYSPLREEPVDNLRRVRLGVYKSKRWIPKKRLIKKVAKLGPPTIVMTGIIALIP